MEHKVANRYGYSPRNSPSNSPRSRRTIYTKSPSVIRKYNEPCRQNEVSEGDYVNLDVKRKDDDGRRNDDDCDYVNIEVQKDVTQRGMKTKFDKYDETVGGSTVAPIYQEIGRRGVETIYMNGPGPYEVDTTKSDYVNVEKEAFPRGSCNYMNVTMCNFTPDVSTSVNYSSLPLYSSSLISSLPGHSKELNSSIYTRIDIDATSAISRSLSDHTQQREEHQVTKKVKTKKKKMK